MSAYGIQAATAAISVKKVPSKAAAELSILKDYLSKTLQKLRPVDEDGVQPPVISDQKRVLRPEVITDSLTGARGPANPALIQMRIRALLLTQYEMRCNRAQAALTLEVMGINTRQAIWLYATPEEYAYNPYGAGPHLEIMGLKEYIATLESLLRPMDNDGILKPPVRTTEAPPERTSPRYTELSILRIRAVMLTQYQFKLSRRMASEMVAEKLGNVSASVLMVNVWKFGTQEEVAYLPYRPTQRAPRH